MKNTKWFLAGVGVTAGFWLMVSTIDRHNAQAEAKAQEEQKDEWAEFLKPDEDYTPPVPINPRMEARQYRRGQSRLRPGYAEEREEKRWRDEQRMLMEQRNSELEAIRRELEWQSLMTP